jgi:hypothetical protein
MGETYGVEAMRYRSVDQFCAGDAAFGEHERSRSFHARWRV